MDRKSLFCAIAYQGLILLAFVPSVRAGLTFNLIDVGGASSQSAAGIGFQRAADFWSSKYSDNIVVNIEIGFSALGNGIIGQASSRTETSSYSRFRSAAVADARSASDATYTSNLPAGNAFNVLINRTADNPNGANSAIPYLDSSGANNETVRMTSANAKALGLLAGNNPAIDAAIAFSSRFNFDFDPTNGIAAGAFDFVGVAIHEIGHALGFISGVDIVDTAAAGNPADAFTFVSPLDFTRFSTASFAAQAIDFTADTRSKYYSIDGGRTVVRDNAWALGALRGDGRQASHWKDGGGIGVMDPTLGPGERAIVSELDLQAFDVIGFDLIVAIPEPSSMMLALLGLFQLASSRHRARLTR